MGVLLGINAILWIAGFLLPLPSFVLALRGWFQTKSTPPAKAWRRKISQVSLGLFALGLALWAYALLRNWSGSYVEYNGAIATVGSWGSTGMIIPSALAESKVRIYLLIGALGLLFYFGVSLGEIAI
jgi:hypothetical protein